MGKKDLVLLKKRLRKIGELSREREKVAKKIKYHRTNIKKNTLSIYPNEKDVLDAQVSIEKMENGSGIPKLVNRLKEMEQKNFFPRGISIATLIITSSIGLFGPLDYSTSVVIFWYPLFGFFWLRSIINDEENVGVAIFLSIPIWPIIFLWMPILLPRWWFRSRKLIQLENEIDKQRKSKQIYLDSKKSLESLKKNSLKLGKIQKSEIYIKNLIEKNLEIAVEINDVYSDIKHLIPYSNFLKD